MTKIMQEILDIIKTDGPQTNLQLVEKLNSRLKLRHIKKMVTPGGINSRIQCLYRSGNIIQVRYQQRPGSKESSRLVAVWGERSVVAPRRPIPLMLDLGERYAD